MFCGLVIIVISIDNSASFYFTFFSQAFIKFLVTTFLHPGWDFTSFLLNMWCIISLNVLLEYINLSAKSIAHISPNFTWNLMAMWLIKLCNFEGNWIRRTMLEYNDCLPISQFYSNFIIAQNGPLIVSGKFSGPWLQWLSGRCDNKLLTIFVILACITHSNLLGIAPSFVKSWALIPSTGVLNLKEIETWEGCFYML